MAIKIKVLKIEDVGGYVPNLYRVYITKHQMMKLPEWVHGRRGVIKFFEAAEPRHRYTGISAKDELEALMRFQKLWAALITLEEK